MCNKNHAGAVVHNYRCQEDRFLGQLDNQHRSKGEKRKEGTKK